MGVDLMASTHALSQYITVATPQPIVDNIQRLYISIGDIGFDGADTGTQTNKHMSSGSQFILIRKHLLNSIAKHYFSSFFKHSVHSTSSDQQTLQN